MCFGARMGRIKSGGRRADTLSALRSAIDLTMSPPQPTITRLIEIVVHAEDIRRPLQIHHDYSTTHLAEALNYLTRDRISGAKARLMGLRLHTTDIPVEVGSGDRIDGPAVPLLLAASGRRAALDDLSGPGWPTLAYRLHGDNL